MIKTQKHNDEYFIVLDKLGVIDIPKIVYELINEQNKQLNKFKSLVKPAHKNTLSQIDTLRNSVQHIFRLDGELYIGALIKEGDDIYCVDDKVNRRYIDRNTPCICTEELHLLFGEE